MYTMGYAFPRRPLSLGCLRVRPTLSGGETVNDTEVGEPLLFLGGQGLVGGVRARELRITTGRVALTGGKQGCPLRNCVGSAINVPEKISLPIPREHGIGLRRIQRDGGDLRKLVFPGRVRHHLT